MHSKLRYLVLPCCMCVALHAGCSREAPSSQAEPAHQPKPAQAAKPAEAPAPAEAAALTEEEKIELLIQKVESMQDAIFIRNGTEHTPTEAAKHMRDKWQWKSSEIKTAEDFIEIAASKSSITGKPYLIRFVDGREVTSAELLNAELEKLNQDAGPS